MNFLFMLGYLYGNRIFNRVPDFVLYRYCHCTYVPGLPDWYGTICIAIIIVPMYLADTI
jgi:hypothetical protein